MRVVRNNKLKGIECGECGSELEYSVEDVAIGYLGQAYVTCPVCGEKVYLYDEDLDIEITEDNIEFPDHFYHFGAHDGAVVASNAEINKWIKEALQHFRKNPDDFYYLGGSGDTYLIVENYPGDEEYKVVVCRNYYESSIPYNKIDRMKKRDPSITVGRGVNMREKITQE